MSKNNSSRIVLPETDHSTASESLPSAGILLADRLRSWREQHNIAIKWAAAELGVSFATWDHWENGRRFPSMNDLNRLAQYLRLSPCLLLCPFKNSQCSDCPNNNKKSSEPIKSSSSA